jgi:hypothetical protein
MSYRLLEDVRNFLFDLEHHRDDGHDGLEALLEEVRKMRLRIDQAIELTPEQR